MLTRNRTWVRWFAALASVLDMWDVVLIPYDLMDVEEVVPLVGTQVLSHRGSMYNDREDQVIDRPLVVFVGSSHVNRQRCATLIDQHMYLATQFGSVCWVLARLLTT